MSSGRADADKPFSGVVVVFTGVHRKSVVSIMVKRVRVIWMLTRGLACGMQAKYYREITALGGKVSDTIDESSSFLVVRRVGSEKYVVRIVTVE